MKLKNILLTALVSGSLTGSAWAVDVVLYVTGAPAFRANTNATIDARVAALNGTGSPVRSAGLTATSANATTASAIQGARANQWKITNYPNSGDTLTINAAHQGAAAAILSVSSPGTKTQVYIPDGTGAIGSPLINQVASEAHAGDVGFANVFQVSTGFLGTKTFATSPSTSNTDTYASLYRSQPLAISPYRFVASKGFPGTNVNSQQLEALFRDGPQPLSFFTGNSADHGVYVYATGRDNGSGLRIGTQVETGVGLTTQVKHYKPSTTGGTVVGSNIVGATLQSDAPDIWPAGVVPSTGFYKEEGDTGYVEFGGTNVSTSQLAVLTGETSPPGQYYLIASLEATDATTAIANGAVSLTYNGVTYSTTALQQGQYPFWAYQFLYRKTSLSGTKKTFSDLLENNWVLLTSVSPASLDVERFADGGTITPKF
jgi:hypothetical protein